MVVPVCKQQRRNHASQQEHNEDDNRKDDVDDAEREADAVAGERNEGEDGAQHEEAADNDGGPVQVEEDLEESVDFAFKFEL